MPGTQRDFDQLARQTARSMANLADDLRTLRIDAYQWADEMDALLTEAHAQAHYQGRYRAGDRVGFGPLDAIAGEVAMEREGEYLTNFRNDLVEGRYDTTSGLNARAVLQRSELYLGSVSSTADRAMTGTLADSRLWYWMLGAGPAERHCGRCPQLAAQGPYRADELTIFPGDGRLPCRNRCRCQLKSGRRRGFRTKGLKR